MIFYNISISSFSDKISWVISVVSKDLKGARVPDTARKDWMPLRSSLRTLNPQGKKKQMKIERSNHLWSANISPAILVSNHIMVSCVKACCASGCPRWKHLYSSFGVHPDPSFTFPIRYANLKNCKRLEPAVAAEILRKVLTECNLCLASQRTTGHRHHQHHQDFEHIRLAIFLAKTVLSAVPKKCYFLGISKASSGLPSNAMNKCYEWIILLLTLYTNILSNSFQNSSWRISLRNWKTWGIQSWARPLHLFHRHFNHVQYAASFCSKLHEEPYRANKWVGRGQMNPEMHKRRRAGHERPFFPLSLLSSLLVKKWNYDMRQVLQLW